jgi:poly(3-hydroxybutyrate) depolymerase
MLYQAYQLQSDLVSPLRLAAQHLSASLWIHKTERTVVRKVAAACDVLSRLRLTHSRPPYNIHAVTVGETEIPVIEETVLTLPFGTLLRFRKDDPSLPEQPKVLLAAPLSGHFATLLRETAKTLLQDHDVYITDWHNARDVSLLHGGFSLDDYISYLIRFTEAVGEGSHMIAVCQPCVAALAATAVMAEDDKPAQPRSLTLMAGPVDCRVNPTEVNKLATSKPI